MGQLYTCYFWGGEKANYVFYQEDAIFPYALQIMSPEVSFSDSDYYLVCLLCFEGAQDGQIQAEELGLARRRILMPSHLCLSLSPPRPFLFAAKFEPVIFRKIGLQLKIQLVRPDLAAAF